jgi:hypothetical protein
LLVVLISCNKKAPYGAFLLQAIFSLFFLRWSLPTFNMALPRARHHQLIFVHTGGYG